MTPASFDNRTQIAPPLQTLPESTFDATPHPLSDRRSRLGRSLFRSQAVDDQEGRAARDGIIALQMHPGPPMKIQFKDLRIKTLKAPESPGN